MKAKVFCIGFHKTGTSSLAKALEELGYRVTGPNGVRRPRIAKVALKLAEKLVPEYDAFQDNPWPIIYKEMDARYPGSKFILVVREPQSWLRSQVSYFGKKSSPMRQWIYGENAGCPEGNEEIYLARYNRHNAEVQEYFKDRPDDLLVMSLSSGDGWEKLCKFLGYPVPDRPFPHVNKGTRRAKAAAGNKPESEEDDADE